MDISTEIKVKLGFEQAKLLQNFSNLAAVASSIFGEGESKKPRPTQSIAEANMQISGLFG